MRLLVRSFLIGSLLLFGCAPGPETTKRVTGVTRVGDVLGDVDADGDGFARAEAVREFEFPRDHGPHLAYKSEWWYLTATMQNGLGQEFGMQFTLFRRGLSPRPMGESAWQSGQIYMAHVAVTDVSQQLHLHDQRLARGHPDSSGVELEPRYRVFLEDWSLSGFLGGAGGGDVREKVELNLDVKSAAGFNLELQLTQSQAILLQGDMGLSAKGPNQASYYYSLPQMTVRGNVVVNNNRHTVTGKAWLDREWSTSVLGSDLVGWDWFAIHFDSNAELTLFQLRRKDCQPDSFDRALSLDASGTRLDYTASELSLEPVQFWRDDTGTDWPIAWQVDLGGERYHIAALVPDQLMETGIRYWEGIVAVSQAGRRIGTGYMEMTGYEGVKLCEG
jgi:predicted secreted hydrolase